MMFLKLTAETSLFCLFLAVSQEEQIPRLEKKEKVFGDAFPFSCLSERGLAVAAGTIQKWT